MDKTCIVVADSRHARFFSIEASDAPRHRPRLVEGSVIFNPEPERSRGKGAGRVRSGRVSNREALPVRPIAAQGERHRLEFERRFGREIASQAGKITSAWTSGAVLLIAAPRLLGLIREALREALHPGIELKELAKDYTALSASELRDRLAIIRLV